MPNSTVTITFHEGDKVVYQHAVGDFPIGMLEQFQEAAFRLFPNDKNAPAKIIAEAIASMCDSDQRTLLINGIPAEAWEATKEVCESAESSFARLAILAMNAAPQNRLHITRIVESGQPEESSHVAVVSGIPDIAWDGLERVAEIIRAKIEKDFSAENVVGLFFQDVAKATVTFNESATGKGGEAGATAES